MYEWLLLYNWAITDDENDEFQGPLLLTWMNLIPAWTSNHIPSLASNDITYPFPNFIGCTVEVWEWLNDSIPYFIIDVIVYPRWD